MGPHIFQEPFSRIAAETIMQGKQSTHGRKGQNEVIVQRKKFSQEKKPVFSSQDEKKHENASCGR